jgi:PIN domain nuclease of toxin-antitoxin system
MFLLDTCTLLWLAADQKKLSLNAKKVIKNNSQELFVSAISAFELAIKSRSGKLKLPLSPLDWFSEALDFHGIRETPITSSIAIFSVQLPLLHSDPCDRLIIATAHLNSMKIITGDALITRYEQANVIW